MTARSGWLAILAAACVFAPAARAAAPRYSVVIVAVDGLRADHLPFYGYGRQTAPDLSARAKQAVVFEHAVAQGSWTLPSFASLFTSRYAESHGLNGMHTVLAPGQTLLAEVLRQAGLRTAGFVGGHFLDPVYGLAGGFELYRGDGMAVYRRFPETAAQAAGWIEAHKDERFFLFVHGNDLHPPFDLGDTSASETSTFDPGYHGRLGSVLVDYLFVQVFNQVAFDTIGLTPARAYVEDVGAARSSPDDLAYITARYDDRILQADAAIEQVFRALERTGRIKDTIVVLLSDHGFELGEKGKLATAFHASQFESITHVPLVIWHPALAPRRVAAPVELVDVAPTLLDWLRVKTPKTFEGASLAALTDGRSVRPPRPYAFSTSSLVTDLQGRILMHSVDDGRWKLIYDVSPPRARLFDLAADPSENTDVAGSHPDVERRLLSALSRHLKEPLPL